MSIDLNGNTFTTWNDVENELFTPEEITESQLRAKLIGTHITANEVKLNTFCRLKRDYKNEKDSIKAYELCIIRKISSKKVDIERVRRKDKNIIFMKNIPIEDVMLLENNITEEEFLDTVLKCTLRYLSVQDGNRNEWFKELLCEYIKGKRKNYDEIQCCYK